MDEGYPASAGRMRLRPRAAKAERGRSRYGKGNNARQIWCAALRVAHKTQRSDPGQAGDRRQYKQYGKVGQRRQEGFVSRS